MIKTISTIKMFFQGYRYLFTSNNYETLNKTFFIDFGLKNVYMHSYKIYNEIERGIYNKYIK